MKQEFVLGKSSSIQGAVVGEIYREGESAGHQIFSHRNRAMGLEIGDGCVLFTDPSQNEELYRHMDWIAATPYREESIRQMRSAAV